MVKKLAITDFIGPLSAGWDLVLAGLIRSVIPTYG
jgi:hypothetical protein